MPVSSHGPFCPTADGAVEEGELLPSRLLLAPIIELAMSALALILQPNKQRRPGLWVGPYWLRNN